MISQRRIYNECFRGSAFSYIYHVETSSILTDYIIRFDHYQEDFNRLMCILGKNITLPHKNKSGIQNYTLDPHRDKLLQHYSQYYNVEARKVVAKHFEVDLKFFGLAFQNVSL